MYKFKVGDRIYKLKGYKFEGSIRAVFHKEDGAVRVVAENGDGILHIYSEDNLGLLDNEGNPVEPLKRELLTETPTYHEKSILR